MGKFVGKRRKDSSAEKKNGKDIRFATQKKKKV